MTQEILVDFSRLDDIVIARIDSELRIDLELAKKLVQQRLDYCQNEDCKLVLVLDKLQQFDKSARNYMSSHEAGDGIIASALVSNSVLGNIIINFFLRLNNTHEFPSKFFKTEESAIEWIKSI
jgi:hypothetical protein